MPVIVGGGGPKRTPDLAARFAAEYNAPFMPIERFVEQRQRVVAACEAIGRDPSTIRTTTAQVVCLGADEAELGRRAEAIGRRPTTCAATAFAGTPDEFTAALQRWYDAGASRLYLQVLDLADLDHLDAIAALVRDLGGGTA